MTLHIFNPEHDIALANGQRRITPPHAARQLHADLGFIPAFWADQGDTVLVDDCQHATRAYAKVRMMAKRLFGLETHDVTFRELTSLRDAIPQSIDPWGWDYTLKAILRQHLPKGVQLPSDNELNLIRNMSHRSTALYLLQALRMENTIGEMRLAETQDELLGYVADFQGKAVLKAPWSSSGRGVRFVDGDIDPHMLDWTANVIAKQGGIMVEPMYNRIIDFGMEFTSLGDGTARYAGLSIFTTSHGAYSGNISQERDARPLYRPVAARRRPHSCLLVRLLLHHVTTPRSFRHRHDDCGHKDGQRISAAPLRGDQPAAHHGTSRPSVHTPRRRYRRRDAGGV